MAIREVASGGDSRRPRASLQRHRAETARRLDVEQHLVAEHVHQVEPHLLPLAGHAGTEEMAVAERPRGFVLGPKPVESVAIKSPAVAELPANTGRPRAQDGGGTVVGHAWVDDGQRPPHVVVMCAQDAQERAGTGNRPAVVDRRGVGRVVAVHCGLVGPVGVHGPERVRIAEIAVHVFPSLVENAAVRQKDALVLEQRALGDLVDVGAVRIHTEQVGSDILAAHVVLRLPRGREHDAVVGQVDGVKIAHVRGERQLALAGAVSIDHEQMQVLLLVSTHGEQDPAAIEVHVRGAHEAVRG